MLIITNNPMVKEKMGKLDIVFVEGTYGDVLAKVRQLIVEDHLTLLTHPLSSSIKPNETFYKTIFVSGTRSQYIHMESLEYIESAVEVYEKFIKSRGCPNWTEKILSDFAFVDCDIAENCLQRMGVLL